ncbi:MAG: glycosyltransferase family 2 protein, partial [Oscillospiraceae bacterium]|nr:glycosyltransferase family 2 protein [Oscillospiraceae bacterium]
MDKLLSVVVPVYKEENTIEPFLQRTEAVFEKEGYNYEIIFCLDPSPDRTCEVIKRNIERNPRIKLIRFSRRFGQPAATIAGILNCSGEACVVIDVDLQDPPELIPQLVERWREGYEVVYAQRISREGETLFKKAVSVFGYWLINRMGEVDIPVNTGDFRLIDRRVIEELGRLNEHHGFLRGMVAFVGFKQTAVQYRRDARYADKGKYNRFTGSLTIGLNGLICFSSKPLKIMCGIGFGFAVFGALLGLFWLIQRFLFTSPIEGFSGLAVLIMFFAG